VIEDVNAWVGRRCENESSASLAGLDPAILVDFGGVVAYQQTTTNDFVLRETGASALSHEVSHAVEHLLGEL